MVEVQKQAFAAVEEAEAEEIVVDECCARAQDDIEHAEAALAFSYCHLRAEGRVAVHVVDVIGEGGVGVVEDGAVQTAGRAIEFNVLVNRPVLESARAATEET